MSRITGKSRRKPARSSFATIKWVILGVKEDVGVVSEGGRAAEMASGRERRAETARVAEGGARAERGARRAERRARKARRDENGVFFGCAEVVPETHPGDRLWASDSSNPRGGRCLEVVPETHPGAHFWA